MPGVVVSQDGWGRFICTIERLFFAKEPKVVVFAVAKQDVESSIAVKN